MSMFKALFISTAVLLSTSAAQAAGTSTAAPAPAPAPMATTPMKPPTSPMQLHCKKGEVVKTMKMNGKSKKMCAAVTGSNLDDNELYAQGWLLAKSGQYDWAITVLSAVQNQNDPDVLNMLGYSNRKAGRVELGISFYSKALAQRPDFIRAREYLGEGYVAAGRIDLAKVQLDEIAKIGGTSSEEYKDLATVISGEVSPNL